MVVDETAVVVTVVVVVVVATAVVKEAADLLQQIEVMSLLTLPTVLSLKKTPLTPLPECQR